MVSLKHRYEQYPQLLKAIARSVHLLGHQVLSFRGHRQEITNVKDSRQNPGNFIAILSETSAYNPVLEKHMNEPLGNVWTYLSPQSQNEIIDVIGKKMIQKGIIEEIKVAGFHSISADEVTASNDGILSISMRYVDANKDICNLFMEFASLKRITGEAIGGELLNFY